FVAAVVEHDDRRPSIDYATQPAEGIDGKRRLAAVIKIMKVTELVIDGTALVSSLDEESPQIDPAIRGAFDVQINLHVRLRHLDRTNGLAIKRDAFQEHPRAPHRHSDAAFGAAAVAHLGQIPLEKLIKLSVDEVGDRGNAVLTQRRDLPHVQWCFVDA